MLNIIEDYCMYRKFRYCRIDGSSSLESRDNQLTLFAEENSDIFIFLLSTRAGGLGINLQTADTVIIYDSDFNPQVDLQAIDRAHRFGQKNPVNVYRLITENTIEEKIRERQYIKLKWDNLLIQNNKQVQNFDKNSLDIDKIISFGANKIIKANNGTISDETIDAILKRGEDKTKSEIEEIDEMMRNKQLGMSLLPMNVKEFDMKIYEDDQQAIDEIQAKAILDQKDMEKEYGRRDFLHRNPRQVFAPRHQFY